jgi:hypothetical protein
MATLATVFSRFFPRTIDRPESAARSVETGTRVRAFANEDIYFYVKRIDNSRVVRQSDPAAREVCWKMIGSAVAAVVLVIGVLMPSAYGLLAGYQIENLRKEAQRLSAERAAMELQEAALLSPAHMQELARIQKFVDPAPEKVVYLNAPGDTELAQATN